MSKRRLRLQEGIGGAGARVALAAAAVGLGGATGAAAEATPAAGAEPAAPAWAYSASVYAYFVPDDREYVQPTVTADYDRLHLEARANYEELETGSAWVGVNFQGGKSLAWEFTPMLGAVFGDLVGFAPGYRGSLSWWRLELFSEGEYVIDSEDASESFGYTWTELTLSPYEGFRFGGVTQRTRLYASDREVQRGFLASFTYHAVTWALYVFDPDQSRPTVVVAMSVEF